MAAKTKTKAKPKTTLHTWAVNIDGALDQIEAENFEPTMGGLFFMIGDTITRAVASGHWLTVELLEPDQD